MGDSTASRSVEEAGAKSTTKNHRPPTNSNCSKFENGLNKNILSRKKDKQTEKLGGGIRRIKRFGDISLKRNIRTKDRNALNVTIDIQFLEYEINPNGEQGTFVTLLLRKRWTLVYPC